MFLSSAELFNSSYQVFLGLLRLFLPGTLASCTFWVSTGLAFDLCDCTTPVVLLKFLLKLVSSVIVLLLLIFSFFVFPVFFLKISFPRRLFDYGFCLSVSMIYYHTSMSELLLSEPLVLCLPWRLLLFTLFSWYAHQCYTYVIGTFSSLLNLLVHTLDSVQPVPYNVGAISPSCYLHQLSFACLVPYVFHIVFFCFVCLNCFKVP